MMHFYLKDGKGYSIKNLSTTNVYNIRNRFAVELFYVQAASVVEFLITEYGPDSFIFFCRQLRDGKNIEEALPFSYPTQMRTVQEMEEKSDGIPCTTVASAVQNSLRWLGIKKIVLASPYVDKINDEFRSYYSKIGFTILDIKNLGITDSYELGTVPQSIVYQLGKEVCRDDAEAIFIPCTTFTAIDVIEDLEKDTGKKVITSNQALAWEMLRITGIDETIEGFGTLPERLCR